MRLAHIALRAFSNEHVTAPSGPTRGVFAAVRPPSASPPPGFHGAAAADAAGDGTPATAQAEAGAPLSRADVAPDTPRVGLFWEGDGDGELHTAVVGVGGAPNPPAAAALSPAQAALAPRSASAHSPMHGRQRAASGTRRTARRDDVYGAQHATLLGHAPLTRKEERVSFAM